MLVSLCSGSPTAKLDEKILAKLKYLISILISFMSSKIIKASCKGELSFYINPKLILYISWISCLPNFILLLQTPYCQ